MRPVMRSFLKSGGAAGLMLAQREREREEGTAGIVTPRFTAAPWPRVKLPSAEGQNITLECAHIHTQTHTESPKQLFL